MSKFKVGDKVRLKAGDSYYKNYEGMTGVIDSRDREDDKYDWFVIFNKVSEPYEEKYLKLVKPGRPRKVKLVEYVVKNKKDKVFLTRRALGIWLKGKEAKEAGNLTNLRIFEGKKELKVNTSLSIRKV